MTAPIVVNLKLKFSTASPSMQRTYRAYPNFD
jgi:hypothetical protein